MHKEFERSEVSVMRDRKARRTYTVEFVDHSGVFEPLQRHLVFPSTCAGLERRVYELLVLLRELGGNIVPEKAYLRQKLNWRMLLEVVVIVAQNPLLRSPCRE